MGQSSWLSHLFVRGDTLVLASETLAKIWRTEKGLQVMEAGLNLFTGISGPFSEWLALPEAASFLGSCAVTRRRLLLDRAALRLLVSTAEDGEQKQPMQDDGQEARPMPGPDDPEVKCP